MKKVLITGITGTLGSALGKHYLNQGCQVIGVSRKAVKSRREDCTESLVNDQATEADAKKIVELEADLIILNAGQIENEIGSMGEPLVDVMGSINKVNYEFPAAVSLVATAMAKKPIDIVIIGSIADGAPSSFGPIYHSSKIAIHYFVTGTGPILRNANSNIRLRLYRPGAIHGPLSWAPTNRLNDKGYKVRAKRCENAPSAEMVTDKIAAFIEGDAWVGTYEEPLSFRLLKFLFNFFPNFYYRLQMWSWKNVSKFSQKVMLSQGSESKEDKIKETQTTQPVNQPRKRASKKTSVKPRATTKKKTSHKKVKAKPGVKKKPAPKKKSN